MGTDNWISVDERLPEEDVWVLFSNREKGWVEMGVMIGKNFVLPQCDYLKKDATHWQKIPDPPKKLKK